MATWKRVSPTNPAAIVEDPFALDIFKSVLPAAVLVAPEPNATTLPEFVVPATRTTTPLMLSAPSRPLQPSRSAPQNAVGLLTIPLRLVNLSVTSAKPQLTVTQTMKSSHRLALLNAHSLLQLNPQPTHLAANPTNAAAQPSNLMKMPITTEYWL